MVAVSAGHEYLGGTIIVASAAVVQEMSVVRRMRGVGAVCEIGMYLDRGGVGVSV